MNYLFQHKEQLKAMRKQYRWALHQVDLECTLAEDAVGGGGDILSHEIIGMMMRKTNYNLVGLF